MRNFASITIALVGIFTANVSMAASHGILGLFDIEGDDFGRAVTEFSHADGNCRIQRAGIIVGQQGDIDLDQPNHFILLACGDTDIEGPQAQEILSPFSGHADETVILSGPASHFPEDDSPSAIGQRSYIVKVSHFGNADPASRMRDLAALRQATLDMADRYRRETFLKVTDAVGMETPDEVALIFYEDAGQGARFRDNNPDFLEKIGAFNKAHLNDHIYYFGQAIR